MATVKVAVRVRPFNKRELEMNAQPIIEMEGKKTRICNSKVAASKLEGEASREKYKDFTFDYSYWSYDHSDDHFASQEQVFKDLGCDVVKDAFQGYNACVFAYGQTGSGKTHTMMGAASPPEYQGLIPRICQDMFNRMKHGKEKGTTYRTEVSYLEIYNERVKDLLKGDQTHSLRVREHPKHGPYVEGLSKHLVMDYDDILGLMNRGNSNRTTACTNMNDVSSRSHAIFTMTFVQASFVGDMPSETVSKVHLVDLAGSERADATGATGQRLKEGAHINKSLVTLGSVISALAEASQVHGQKKVFIPYRDSVLTWLLKDSLGGNAKTIMIATISPADCNYGETLSTLRYANRAKNIINKPTINEDPNVKLIRDLRNEIQKLKTMLGSNDIEGVDVLEELQKKEAKEKTLTEEWTDKWKETQKILMEQKDLTLRKAGPGVILDSQMPHLIGIDDDLHSTGITLYHLKEGETKIGSDESNEDKHDITLKGQGLESLHCSIMLENGVATLVPNNGAVCCVNGQQVDKPTRLFQGCVILMGRTNMFRYNDPAEAEKMRKEGSRSHLNLNRLSFLSRSTTDLAWSENSIASSNGEENSVLEEKRKQLEAEEARLQKESQTLMEQKKLLEEQKQNYQLLQAEKEEAWKAEQLNKSSAIQCAQKELEERRRKLELEYAAHRRRLEEDWKRLEQQEQETLASLQSKEKDLKRRRELLEWEIDQEMEQIETEAQKIESLRTNLESKQQEVDNFAKRLTSELQQKLGRPEEELKPLLLMEESKFEDYVREQSAKVDSWKADMVANLQKQRENVLSKTMELAEKLKNCDDEKLKELYEKEKSELQYKETSILKEIENAENNYLKERGALADSSTTLKEYRSMFLDRSRVCQNLEDEVEKGIAKMMASEDKMSRLESDLALIADQEKSIVTQLAHIDSSKQKLKTIIENTADSEIDDIDERRKQLKLDIAAGEKAKMDLYIAAATANSDNSSSNQIWNVIQDISEIEDNNDENTKTSTPKASSSPYQTRDSSPSRIDRNNGINNIKSNISPIKSLDNFTRKLISPGASIGLHMTPAEITMELKRLVEQINDQKTVVLECLENDCDKEELNGHMAILQELRNRYLEIECLLDNTSRRRWLGYEEEDSTFDFEKTEDSTIANDSELDDSEAQSSVTDQDDIQSIIDQEVEKRLKEIFEQLKQGQKSNIFMRQQRRRSLRNSMPSGLNHVYGSGSEDEGSSHSPQLPLPRSISMNSGIWSSFAHGEGVIPGVLDVTIPSFVLRGNGSSTHFEYEVCIITPHDRWSVLRRYQRFRDLYSYMRKKYGSKIANISFPPKKFLGRRSEKLAKERQKLLEIFLQMLMQTCSKLPTCPLYNCTSHKIKDALTAFSPFFQKGFFESTIYGTS